VVTRPAKLNNSAEEKDLERMYGDVGYMSLTTC
jgi:hypothetical protein